MLVTEEQAKGMWCPAARRVIDAPGYAAGNRFGDAAPQNLDCRCIGSVCMWWRKSGMVGVGPNGETRERDQDGRTRWLDTGYCGMAGEPQ